MGELEGDGGCILGSDCLILFCGYARLLYLPMHLPVLTLCKEAWIYGNDVVLASEWIWRLSSWVVG